MRIKYVFYLLYNLLYQVLIILFCVFANTYLNEVLVPSNLMWKNNRLRTDHKAVLITATIKAIAVLAEASILIILIYSINRLFLNYAFDKNRSISVAKLTAKTNIVLAIIFIVILIWGSYRIYF
jgi:hypothetical protein